MGIHLPSGQGGAAGDHGQQGPPQTPLLVLTLSGGPWAMPGTGQERAITQCPDRPEREGSGAALSRPAHRVSPPSQSQGVGGAGEADACPSLQELAVCPAHSMPLKEKPKKAAWRRKHFSWALDAWKGREGGRALQVAQSKVMSSPWNGMVALGPPLALCFCSLLFEVGDTTPLLYKGGN